MILYAIYFQFYFYFLLNFINFHFEICIIVIITTITIIFNIFDNLFMASDHLVPIYSLFHRKGSKFIQIFLIIKEIRWELCYCHHHHEITLIIKSISNIFEHKLRDSYLF